MSLFSKDPLSLAEISLPAGLAPAATGVSLIFNVSGMLNGTCRGIAWQDVAGVFTIEQGYDPSTFDNIFTVTQDLTQPDFRYPFYVSVLQPFWRFTFVNGAAPSTFFRANFSALPV